MLSLSSFSEKAYNYPSKEESKGEERSLSQRAGKCQMHTDHKKDIF